MSHSNTVTEVGITDYSGSKTDYRLVRSVGDGLRKSLGVTHVKTGGGVYVLCFGNRRLEEEARGGCEQLWLCSVYWLNVVTGGRRQNG